ncbi:hypothetical protein ILUMI_24690 [Ignelater luminosus]|uniref:TIL domain-containing protein n=1 Tax=Ignelater luminosus TaxID=2038154 RepID=A0A8K0CA12_IGNLU|nr:hypothetical protein ILUMI_24690 [Ignelater luminosus]
MALITLLVYCVTLFITVFSMSGPRPVKSPAGCGVHEYFDECGTPCLPDCMSPILDITGCRYNPCRPGCVCKPGFIRIKPHMHCVRKCPKNVYKFKYTNRKQPTRTKHIKI